MKLWYKKNEMYYQEILKLHTEYNKDLDQVENDPFIGGALELREVVDCAILDGADPEEFIVEMMKGIKTVSLWELMSEFSSWNTSPYDTKNQRNILNKRKINQEDERLLLALLNKPKRF